MAFVMSEDRLICHKEKEAVTRRFGLPTLPANLSILERADVDKTIAACTTKMGQTVFSASYEHGQKMSLDEAVALLV